MNQPNLYFPFLAIFSLFSTISLAQVHQRVVVVDSITNQGIEKVTVYINKAAVALTDKQGIAQLDKSTVNANAEVIFSCVGYHSVQFSSNTHLTDTVRLSMAFTNLSQVNVKPQKAGKAVTLGLARKRYNARYSGSANFQCLQYIPNPQKLNGKIAWVNFALNNHFQGIEKPFKVRLFTKTPGQLYPGEELTKDSIFVQNPAQAKLVKVDVSMFDIDMPEDGVIAVFETLSPAVYGFNAAKSTTTTGWRSVKLPSVEVYIEKGKGFRGSYATADRAKPYAMIRSKAELARSKQNYQPIYVLDEGINFGITVTVATYK